VAAGRAGPAVAAEAAAPAVEAEVAAPAVVAEVAAPAVEAEVAAPAVVAGPKVAEGVAAAPEEAEGGGAAPGCGTRGRSPSAERRAGPQAHGQAHCCHHWVVAGGACEAPPCPGAYLRA
jgi:hypothetical protein